MSGSKIKKIVVVGGGTAGWMAASSLSSFLRSEANTEIVLVESSQIGTVGVGEATLPTIRGFNLSLGIDEVDFIKKTRATFKLGIEFKDWYKVGQSFFHPFASYGVPINSVGFHHFHKKFAECGYDYPISDFCFPSAMVKQNKFAQPHANPSTPLASYSYAFHFDAVLYAKYLSDYAIGRGVKKYDDIVTSVKQDEKGFIESIILESGEEISGDLFIDCSGFQGLLIEKALKTGYENWTEWLPCDRAVAVQSEVDIEPTPFTRATAHEAGWRWRIPLQHRMGNGYVYCSQFIDDERAEETLLNNVEGKVLNTPRILKFVTGMRKKFWNKNCIALGLASGFMEPLESTSIALIQAGISKLQTFFPHNGFNEADIQEANRLNEAEFNRIRDFLILHYKANQRGDNDFWKQCQSMPIPDTLAHKIELYKSRGHLVKYEEESFEDGSWLTMYNGFNIQPDSYDPRVDWMPQGELVNSLLSMRKSIQGAAGKAPSHAAFIAKHCRSDLP